MVHSLLPAVSGTLISTWLLAFAYKNTKHVLKHKLAVKREAAVTKEMNKKLADDKKISKKEKDERILWKKNEVEIDIFFRYLGAALLNNCLSEDINSEDSRPFTTNNFPHDYLRS